MPSSYSLQSTPHIVPILKLIEAPQSAWEANLLYPLIAMLKIKLVFCFYYFFPRTYGQNLDNEKQTFALRTEQRAF